MDAPPPNRHALSSVDLMLAGVSGTAALALFVATLQPAFGGPEDTPKFQFIGYVLGTPHPPGYPLYILLSNLFVRLPIGTIAYRANLFSAAMASVACALGYMMSRQIGARRWPACCATLALAAGASFWRSAVFAEVYSLAATMAALTVVLLLSWHSTRRIGYLLAAAASFSLGLGNHLTILGLAPACALFVLFVDRRALSPRVIAALVLILAIGIAQYGLILLRTRQGAPYLESQAASIPQLVEVMTASRFASERFAFSPTVLLTDHLPVLVRTLGEELGFAGTILLSIGLASAARRRAAATTTFVTGGALGMLGMAVNVAGDVKGFITPVMVLLWPFAALGVTTVGSQLESWPRVGTVTAAVVTVAASLAMPLANLSRNFAVSDQSGHYEAARFYRALFAQLPDNAALVIEDYAYDMAARYFTLTGEGGARRSLMRLPFNSTRARDAGRDHRVFAFGRAAAVLEAEGLEFRRWPVAGPTLEEWLGWQPRDTIVAGASAFVAAPRELFRVGRGGEAAAARPPAFAAFALVAGRRGAVWREGDDPLSLVVNTSTVPGMRKALVQQATAAASPDGARVELGGDTVAHVESGLAFFALRPDGSLLQSVELPAGDRLRVPFEEAVYEMIGQSTCTVVSDEWTDISRALATGSWLSTFPEVGHVVVETEIGSATSVDVRELIGAGSARNLGPSPDAGRSGSIATELTRTGSGRPVFRVALDRRPAAARARVRPGGARTTLTVCAQQPRPLFADGRNVANLAPDFESEAYFGAGWSEVERAGAVRVRRLAREATIFLPLETGVNYEVRLNFSAAKTTTVDLAFNGAAVGTCTIGRPPCEIVLPGAAVVPGINALIVRPRDQPTSEPVTFRGARIARVAPARPVMPPPNSVPSEATSAGTDRSPRR